MTRPHPIRSARAAIKGFGFKQWFLLILNIILVLGSVACLLGLRTVSHALITLDAADRFRGESELRFAQLAAFLPVGQGKTEEDIFRFRQSLDTALTEQSMEVPEKGSLYIDAYSGPADLTASTENGTASVTALGVGGDFFYFHPLPLLGGSYIDEDDLMDDLVVLDEEMAWRLYGSTDLAGMTVYLNETPFVVSGVVARETDFATARSYTGGGGVFLSWSALARLVEDAQIDCYELVMPDPISHYAKGVVEDNFSVGSGDIVENSGRYRPGRLLEVIRGYGERSMRVNGVIYPYWENAARLTEDYAALLMLLAVLLALCPAIFALVLGIRALRRSWKQAKETIPARIEAAAEQRKEERLEKAYKKKTGGGGENG